MALCDSIAACEAFMNAAKQKYYAKLIEKGKLQQDEMKLDDVLFMTSPQRGAEIFVL